MVVRGEVVVWEEGERGGGGGREVGRRVDVVAPGDHDDAVPE